jgi:hypothetical protein
VGVWPRALTHALTLEWGILLVFAIAWQWASGTFPLATVKAALVVLSALAMGVQSVAARRLDVSGIATTYITGTLTSLMTRLMGWRRRGGPPHRRQPVTSRSRRFAPFSQEWHSCVVQTEEKSLCSDVYLRESKSSSNWSTPCLPTGKP